MSSSDSPSIAAAAVWRSAAWLEQYLLDRSAAPSSPLETRFAAGWALTVARTFAAVPDLCPVRSELDGALTLVREKIWAALPHALEGSSTYLSWRIIALMPWCRSVEMPVLSHGALAPLVDTHQAAFTRLLGSTERSAQRSALVDLVRESQFAAVAVSAGFWLDFVCSEVEAQHCVDDVHLEPDVRRAYRALLDLMLFSYHRQRDMDRLTATFHARLLLDGTRTQDMDRVASYLAQQYSSTGGIASDKVAYHLAGTEAADPTRFETDVVFRMSMTVALALLDYLALTRAADEAGP